MKFFNFLTFLMIFNIGLTQEVILSYGTVDESAGTVEVVMTNTEDIAGFQFDLSGLDVTGASGGSAASNGFMVSTSSTRVVGFSLSGAVIPAGSGILTIVTFENFSDLVCYVEGSGVFATAGGAGLSVDDTACYENAPCDDEDADGICDDDDDCVGELDECGVCNGDGETVECWDGSMVCDAQVCPDEVDNHYNVDLAETGEFQLVIFQNSITSLEVGDEVGIFDDNGIIETCNSDDGCSDPIYGVVLVGAGVWTGSQLEISTIMSVDLSDFNGPVLNGAVDGNSVVLKVYRASQEMEYNAVATWSTGSGNYGDLILATSELELSEPEYNVDLAETGAYQLVIFQDSITSLEVGDEVGVFDAMGVVETCNPDDGCSDPIYGEILVGAGVWTGIQLEVNAIMSIDLSDFAGPVLNGAVDGNSVVLKVYRASQEMEYNAIATWSTGSGNYGDLILAVSELTLQTEEFNDYSIAVNEFFFRAASGTSVPDYVELVNYGDEDVDLTGWTLMGEDLGGTIAAGGYLLVAGEDPFFNADGDELYAGEDIDNSIFSDISLGTSSGEITLLDASGNEIDYLEYGDGWPVGNDNRGHAIELNNPSYDNSDPSNWTSAGMDCMSEYLYGEDGSDEELLNFGSPAMLNCIAGGGPQPIYGCMDIEACNYDSEATDDDGSCEYEDCLGECGGDAVVDECGVCNGDGIPDGDCDCLGNVEDCLGECGGDAYEDMCETCDDDATNDCIQDCNGEWGGDAVLDNCAECDNTSENDCIQDCNEEWGGDVVVDDCGVCDGDSSSCEVYIETSLTTTVDEIVLEDIETFEEDFESLIETQLDLPEGTVEVTDIIIVSRDELEIIVEYTITLTEEELADTDYEDLEDIVEDLEEVEEEIESGGDLDFIYGCSDPSACNYNTDSNIDDGSCGYAEEYYDCENNCLNDDDGDLVCNELEVVGCTDSEALNYNPDATDDDGTCEFSTIVNYNLDLHYGANLVSFWAIPEDNSVGNVMASLGTIATGVIGEGVAASQIAPGIWVGSLSSISPTSGYWVKVDDEGVIELIEATPTDAGTVYELHYGANLISFPFEGSISIGDGLPDDVEAEFTGVIGEGVAASQIAPGTWVGSLSHWSGTKGYWAKVDNGVSFSFNAPSMMRADELLEESPYGYAQSTEQAFYFVEDIEGADYGDWILAYNNNKLIGAREWNGMYTDIPAMGNDGSMETSDYLSDGDVPIFYLVKEYTGEQIELTGILTGWESNAIYTVNSLTELVIPDEVSLSSAYPNPFNPETTLEYSVESSGMVELVIYDINGRLVSTLFSGVLSSGNYSASWDASKQPSGLYIAQLTSDNTVQTTKLVLLK